MQKIIGSILKLQRELHGVIKDKMKNEVRDVDQSGQSVRYNVEIEAKISKFKLEIGITLK